MKLTAVGVNSAVKPAWTSPVTRTGSSDWGPRTLTANSAAPPPLTLIWNDAGRFTGINSVWHKNRKINFIQLNKERMKQVSKVERT